MTLAPEAAVLRVAVARCLAEQGLTQRKTAKKLNKSPSVIRYHAGLLLSRDVIRVKTGDGRGTWMTFEKGERWNVFIQAARGGQESDRILRSGHRPPALPHRGARNFPVIVAPSDLSKVAGLYKSKEISKVPNHWFHHIDGEGRPWTVQFINGKTRRSVNVNPPILRIVDPKLTETGETWWVAWIEKEAHTWAQVAGFKLADSTANRHAKIGIPTKLPTFGTEHDRIRVDGSPFPGTLEIQGDDEFDPWAITAAIQRLPETTAVVDDRLAEIESKLGQAEVKLDQVESNLLKAEATQDRLIGVAERMQALFAKNQRTMTAVLEMEAAALSTPQAPPPQSEPGAEYA